MIHACFRQGRARSLAAASVLFAVAGFWASPLAAQCTLAQGQSPLQFESNPPGVPRPGALAAGYTTGLDLYKVGSTNRLMVVENWGYSVLSLANPGNPIATAYVDMRQQGVAVNGDGQSYVATLGVAPDGSRAVVSTQSPSRFNNVLMQPGLPDGSFAPAGDFTPASSTGGVVIQQLGTRYMAWALKSDRLGVADVTSFSSLSPESIASEATSFPGGNGLLLTGPYIVYQRFSSVVVINASSPAANIPYTAGMPNASIPNSAWQRPSGESLAALAAAADPADSNRLYLLGAFRKSDYTLTGYSLMTLTGGPNGSLALVGTFTPPAPYSGPGSAPGDVLGALATTSNDVIFFMWAKTSSPLTHKLYTKTALNWGAAPGEVLIPASAYPLFGLRQMRLLASGLNVYSYIASGSAAYVLPLSCVSLTGPPQSALGVTGPGGPLSSGDTVFLGDTVSITPIINPPPSLVPLSDWRFDFDYHSAAEPNLSLDLSGSSGAPPSPITLVGPCDPTGVPSGSPSSGANCWLSVQNNGPTAGGTPDYTSPFPAPGTSKALPLALRATNDFGIGNVGTFTLNWKVPAVRLQSTQILSGAALNSGSEGHPVSTGFKWWFGSTPGAPGNENLAQDLGCTGPSCTHPFPGNGTYNYWLTAAYPNGYSSPDCVNPCTQGTITVTDVVPLFTAPSSALTTNPNFSVTNSSQIGGGVSNISYLYCLVKVSDAGGLACTPNLPITFSGGTASITTPSFVGDYWLSFDISYTNGSGQQTSHWMPNVTGVPATAWPIAVSDLPPIPRIEGSTSCGGPGGGGVCDFHAFVGDSLHARVYRGLSPDPGPLPSLQWTFTGPGAPAGCGPSSSCQGYAFSFTQAGSVTVTMNGLGAPITLAGTIDVHQPLRASTTGTSPTSITVGGTVNFRGSASGGSGLGYNYLWNFGDGSPTTTVEDPSHTYSSIGSPQAVLTVHDSAGGTATASVAIQVGSGGGGGGGGGGGCTTDFRIVQDSFGTTQTGFDVTSGVAVTFASFTSAPSYNWNFGDGTTSNASSPTKTYNTTTNQTYTASLTANGCTKSGQVRVQGSGGGGGPPATTIDFEIRDLATDLKLAVTDNRYNAIGGQALKFVPLNTTGAVYWDFGDGASSEENVGRHTYTPVVLTSYTATLLANGQQKKYGVVVLANAALTGNYSFHYVDNSPLLTGAVAANKAIRFFADDPDAETYEWDFGDGTAHVIQPPPVDHSFTKAGTFVVKLSVTKSGQSPATTAAPYAFTVLPPPEPLQWVVAGMSYTGGIIPGTLWQSDVSIYNPDPALPARFSVALLGQGDPSQLVWHSLDLDPQQSRSYTNILGSVYGLGKGAFGALLIKGEDVPVPPVITARTYNAGDAANGTFGLSIPAASSTGGISTQAASASTVLIGLRDDEDAYTNVGFVNLKGDYATAELTFHGPDGQTQLGQTVTVQLGPYDVRQISRILLASPPTGAGYRSPVPDCETGCVTGYTLSVRLIAGKGVYPYATVVDRKSTDPIVVTATDNPAASYRLPGVVRTTGKKDTIWRSRVFVHNTSSSARLVNLSFSYVACPAGASCLGRKTDTGSGPIAFGPNETKGVDDFVRYWLEANNPGLVVSDSTLYLDSYIDVSPADSNTDPLLVLGHLFNNQPGGDVGTQIPGFTASSDAASSNGPNKRLLFSGLFSDNSFRTNLALFLLNGSSGNAMINIYAPSGDLLRQRYVGFDSQRSFVQINNDDLFSGITGDRSNLSVVVDSVTGTIAGYATLVDNVSGDSTLVRATPAP